jgi:hypothetical protein
MRDDAIKTHFYSFLPRTLNLPDRLPFCLSAIPSFLVVFAATNDLFASRPKKERLQQLACFDLVGPHHLHAQTGLCRIP